MIEDTREISRRGTSIVRKARRLAEVLLPKRYILVLSHMRSYSSLMCHILNSNPEVAGYVETHSAYSDRRDLWRLKARVFLKTDAEVGGRYVLDKLLHNRSWVDPALLRSDDVFVIFGLREPRRTIQSTVAMGRRLDPRNWKANPEKVINAYVKRVNQLRRLAYEELRHAIFIDAQHFIDDSSNVLDELSAFLSLKEPLSENYKTSKLTGAQTFGDPGKFIKAGSIVRDRENYSDIELPEEKLKPAFDAYESALAALRSISS